MNFVSKDSPKRYTTDQFMRMSETRGGKLIELIEGIVEEKPVPSRTHSALQRLMRRQIEAFIDQHDLGYVFEGNADFILNKERATVRKPNVAFLAKKRIATIYGEDAFPIAPDLVVEIWTYHDYNHYPFKARSQISDYMSANVPILWIVAPRQREVYVYHPESQEPIFTLGIGDTLSGEEVLPGFTLPVATIFEGMPE